MRGAVVGIAINPVAVFFFHSSLALHGGVEVRQRARRYSSHAQLISPVGILF